MAEREIQKCSEMGVELKKIYRLHDLVRSDNIIFSATGITKGDLLDGIVRRGNISETETLLIRGKTGTIRKIKSFHDLTKKDSELLPYIF